MPEPTLLAIDQGTTSSRAVLFSSAGEVLGHSQKELKQYYPQKSWVEHDPEEIWQDTLKAIQEIWTSVPQAKDCVALGITNQRETTIIWDRKTGRPIYNAIVWQDRRTADFCNTLKEDGFEKTITEKTGLLVDPYFSCSKIVWILDNVEGAREKAEKGDLAFGTVDSFLLYKLTGGKVHATDATNASRTGLFNIVTQQWDEELLALYNIPKILLPEVKDNVALFGMTDPEVTGFELPIGGMAGDQHAALIGQGCFKPGMMKATYGTGCFALMNIGEVFQPSTHRLLTTMAYRFNGKAYYASEGSIFIAGAAIQWLRDGLGLLKNAQESEQIARSVQDNNGVYFIPAFTGLGAPYWQPDAHAMISGLTRDTDKAHLVRAALEAQAYQTLDLLKAMHADTGIYPEILRVDGGLVTNKFVCQFLADILQISIELPSVIETTALGAAYLAGLYAGVYKNTDQILKNWQSAEQYDVSMKPEMADELYKGWQKNIAVLLKS
jgi:glycerol kinase